jgi:hypothetical protein
LETEAAGARPIPAGFGVADRGASAVDHREIVARCHVLLRRAILTITAIPDPDARFLSGPKSSMPRPQPDPNVSYDSEAAQAELARAGRFRPTKADLSRYMEVMSWLAWLKRQGEEGELGARLIIYRAYGNSWWKCAQRLKLGRSDDTARRWCDSAVEAIALTFAADILAMEQRTPPRPPVPRSAIIWETAAVGAPRSRRGRWRRPQ